MRSRIRWIATACAALLALAAGTTVAYAGSGAHRVAPQTLRVGFDAPPQGLDPALATIGASHEIIDLVYSGLTKLDANAQPRPDLAKSWTVTSGGRVWTFNLRRGVKFQDGTPLTADDVVFTFKRLINPKTGYSYITQLQSLKNITAVDRYTVRMTLSRPTGPFLTDLAFPGSFIVPKHVLQSGADLGSHPIGTGPFKFVSYSPGHEIILEKNPYYYVPGLPKVQQLKIFYISDATQRTNALLGGQIDFAARVAPKDYGRIVKTPGFKGTAEYGGQWYWIMTNDTKAPLNNPLVRKALSLALDRDALSQALFFGYAKPILGGPIPSWNWAYAKDLNTISPHGDVAAAKALLAKAGYPHGVNLNMTLGSAWQNLVDEGPLVQSMLKKAGINVTLQSMENPRYMDLAWTKGDYQISNMFWLSPLADPDDFMYLNYKCGSPMNPQKYCNQQLDRLLEQARYTLDRKKRAALYHQAEKIVMQQTPLIPTVLAANLDAFSSKVKGWKPERTGFYDSFKSISVSG